MTVEYERLAVSLLACRRSLPGSMDHGHFLSELKGSFSILKLGMGYRGGEIGPWGRVSARVYRVRVRPYHGLRCSVELV